MLARYSSLLQTESDVRVQRYLLHEGKPTQDVSTRGAFAVGSHLLFRVSVPRALGAYAVVLRLNRDGAPYEDTPLTFADLVGGCDVYELTLDTEVLDKGQGGGLYYFEFLFLCGENTWFTDSRNNIDFTLAGEHGRAFRLLLYGKDFTTPDWFNGGILYHIFVDRFAKGDTEYPCREGAIREGEWEDYEPDFPPYAGAPLKNNRFAGGTLDGVSEKLEYLASLGVTTLYLSPVFRAYSNHKYDVGDYMEVDGMFGGREALERLIARAGERGMRVILDGVFNHTGDDSRYFNRYGTYDTLGAYQSPASPFADWYAFREFPDRYESWWGIEILPKLNLHNEDCHRFLTSPEGVAGTYITAGIGGWRLDVADELPDDFLDDFRQTVKTLSGGEALIIGEVWENAADKISYGHRRRYLQGRQLDSVMNYPLRNGILAFLCEGDATTLADALTDLYSSYPDPVCHALMNVLGTHDTERILTVLGGECPEGEDNAAYAAYRMSEAGRERASLLLRLASVIQYTVFGVPSVFYGDEAGLEGYGDPFCRRPYPWGREDKALLAHYRRLGAIRRGETVFVRGSFSILAVGESYIAYERACEGRRVTVVINAADRPLSLDIGHVGVDLYDGMVKGPNLSLPPLSFAIIKEEREEMLYV